MKIFLSHSTEDYSAAKLIAKKLKRSGIRCFVYEKEPTYGKPIPDTIKVEIAKSDIFGVLLSRHAVNSSWVARELGYACALRQQSAFGKRPQILPLHDSDSVSELTHQIQPLTFDTCEPAGSPIDFSEHRTYSVRDNDNFRVLLRSVGQSIRVLKAPFSSEDRQLFDSFCVLYRSLFTDGNDRAEPAEVEEWLKEDSHKTGAFWREELIVAHVAGVVIGFAYVNVHPDKAIGHGGFLAVAPGWRDDGRTAWLLGEIRKYLTGRYPKLQGFLLEVDPISLAEADYFNLDGSPVPLADDALRRLLRLRFFRTLGALVLTGLTESPVLVSQPCIVKELAESNEKRHFLLYLPLTEAAAPVVDERFLEHDYYDSYREGFGPSRRNIPGYLDYLDQLAARERCRLGEHLSFQKPHIDRKLLGIISEHRDLSDL